MNISEFGATLGGNTGIMDLMDDMGRALAGDAPVTMLGGGNPARIPAVEALWRRRMAEILATGDTFERMVGNYDTPQGQPAFLAALAEMLSAEYGWQIGPEHIAVTNGSQTAFFVLLNLFSGRFSDHAVGTDGRRKILFPLLPEYIGYADQALSRDAFVACRPLIETGDERDFRYRVDFAAVEGALTDEIGAICVSRPTNPSGNVLTDSEMARLNEMARAHGVPLIVDNAYGMPFPHIIFEDQIEGSARPVWNENIVLGMSLSKVGLPGTRTGIIVAHPDIIRTLSRTNAVLSLANTMVGQIMVEPLIRDHTLITMATDVIQPFYRARAVQATKWMRAAVHPSVPLRIHRIQGSIFMWIWLEGLPITSRELYERLKARSVLVVPGEYFFFGDRGRGGQRAGDGGQRAGDGAHDRSRNGGRSVGRGTDWRHSRECLRINYGQEPADVETGIGIISEEVNRLWQR